MSKVIKILSMFIIVLLISTSMCFAIDELELYNNTTSNTSNITSSNTSSENTNQIGNDVLNSENSNTPQEIQVENTTIKSVTPTLEDDSSTTVSGVTSISDGSAFTSILYIALIVIGVLLVLLAIAILIRLKS